MTAHRLLPLLAALGFFCLPTTAHAADLRAHTIEHGGLRRTYHVYVPPGHDPAARPVPLVLALHGGGGTATALDASTGGGITREARARGWVVVFPQGVNKGWNDGRPLTGRRDAARAGVDDVAFLSAVIDRVQADLGIDPTRVYATGISNGGFMSFRLGVDLARKIAAIAPVTAQMTAELAAREPARPVPVLLMNGTADPLVPYQGGEIRVFGQSRGVVQSTNATLRRWITRNRCTAAPRTVWLADRARDRTRVQVTTWAGGSEGAEVVLYRIVGGGHTWPGGTQYLGPLLIGRVCRDIDGAKEIFNFFARHRRTPVERTVPASD